MEAPKSTCFIRDALVEGSGVTRPYRHPGDGSVYDGGRPRRPERDRRRRGRRPEGEDEAAALANGTRFGLAGYVRTTDLARAHRVADRLDAGYVSVNGLAGLPPAAPFGGWKASGQGVEGGLAGLREYLRTKNIHIQL
jgi:hypothetical protein